MIMKTKKFFANVASKALALAAVVMMMSAAFTACSSSNDEPTTTPESSTVTLDGKEKPIVAAEYDDNGKGNYILFLYLSANKKERVKICLNKDLHMTGSPVNLAEKEKKHDGKWYWMVEYNKPDGTTLIYTWGGPRKEDPVFKTGTLTVTGDPATGITIKLENGRVKGTDGKEHTITLSYKGKMTEV